MVYIKIEPKSDGWSLFTIEIDGDKHAFYISGALGDSLGEMLSGTYCLMNIEDTNCYCPDFMERQEFEMSGADYECRGNFEAVLAERTTVDMFYKATFGWGEEPRMIKWVLEKPLTIQDDFILHIKIEVQDDRRKEYNYDIDFREFCYALAKAFTQAFKAYGIRGYYEATWQHNLNIEKLIYLKAFALNKLEEFFPKYSE